MELDGIGISQHAWERFQERWQGRPPACWMRKLSQLLNERIPEDLGHGAVLRLIDHGYVGAKYFISSGWRFVFDEEEKLLLTCERPYKKGIQKKQKPFNRKRHGR
jgi:hypothetical protein